MINPHQSRAGCCGCLVLAILLVVLLCALAAFGLVALTTRTASAATEAEPRHAVMLIDFSNSVALSNRSRSLALASAQEVVAALRAAAAPGDRLSVVFFGGQTRLVVTGTLLVDDAAVPDLAEVFRSMPALGSTRLLEALSAGFTLAEGGATPRVTDVIVISDGMPDPVLSSEHAEYIERLRRLVDDAVPHGITVSALLMRPMLDDAWRELWQDVARRSQGLYVEINSATDIARISDGMARVVPARALDTRGIALSPATPTSTSTSTSTSVPTATATATATATPTPTPTSTPMPTSMATPTATPTPTPMPTLVSTDETPVAPTQVVPAPAVSSTVDMLGVPPAAVTPVAATLVPTPRNTPTPEPPKTITATAFAVAPAAVAPAAVAPAAVAPAAVTPAAAPVRQSSGEGADGMPAPWWLLAGLALVAVWLFARRRAARSGAHRSRAAGGAGFPADEGVLEIYDPETDGVERIELRAMTPGEVWLIGNVPHCQICLDGGRTAGDGGVQEMDVRGARGPLARNLDRQTGALEVRVRDAGARDTGVRDTAAGGADAVENSGQEMAALILGHDGPRIESRRTALYYEGRRTLAHRLFDGDHLYLDRFVLYYHNFFRQRALAEESVKE
jgi:hypothetical protein